MMHTHYDPYGPPRQVPGTLLACADAFREQRHKVEHSELWADYAYHPRFGPPSATGLPVPEETRLTAAYTARRAAEFQWRIADVVCDAEYTYRVKITNRTAYAPQESGPTWHTEEWGIWGDGEWHGIPRNPHPGYEHTPPWCPNCGY